MKKGCNCSGGARLVFACSGGADVGEIADRAARKLSAEGVAKMFCLAGVGGRVPGVLRTTGEAASVLAVDGCPLDCARRSLEEAGYSGFGHLRLSDLGMEKGQSAANEERVDTACEGMRRFFS